MQFIKIKVVKKMNGHKKKGGKGRRNDVEEGWREEGCASLEESHAHGADGGSNGNSSETLSSQTVVSIGTASGCLGLRAFRGVLDQSDWTVGRCCILAGTSHHYKSYTMQKLR